MDIPFLPSGVSWRHIYSFFVLTDIFWYLQHPSVHGLLDGLILRWTESDAGYKLHVHYPPYTWEWCIFLL